MRRLPTSGDLRSIFASASTSTPPEGSRPPGYPEERAFERQRRATRPTSLNLTPIYPTYAPVPFPSDDQFRNINALQSRLQSPTSSMDLNASFSDEAPWITPLPSSNSRRPKAPYIDAAAPYQLSEDPFPSDPSSSWNRAVNEDACPQNPGQAPPPLTLPPRRVLYRMTRSRKKSQHPEMWIPALRDRPRLRPKGALKRRPLRKHPLLPKPR